MSSNVVNILSIKLPHTQYFVRTIRNCSCASQKVFKSFCSHSFQNIQLILISECLFFNLFTKATSWWTKGELKITQLFNNMPTNNKCLVELNMRWVQIHSQNKQFHFSPEEWPCKTNFAPSGNNGLIIVTSSKLKLSLTFHTMQVMEGSRLYLGKKPASFTQGHPTLFLVSKQGKSTVIFKERPNINKYER